MRRMAAPFHYSFFVHDLDAARAFYGDLLGCAEGRSAATWVDFDFFGNQISAHVTAEVPRTRSTGEVDGIAVPMPHFGAIVDWEAFHALADRVRAAGVEFVVTPRVRFEGQPGEQATMFFVDPSGNALEFKSFRRPEEVFAPQDR
jgi:extradiol dioxygenase family protein